MNKTVSALLAATMILSVLVLVVPVSPSIEPPFDQPRFDEICLF